MLTEGTRAPPFALKDSSGRPHRLADFRGKTLVLFFYPKDDTPGCTAEACSLRDSYEKLLAANLAVAGVSLDDAASHKKFAEKYDLPFPLLCGTVRLARAYGVYKKKNLYGKTFWGIQRTTFLIDPAGKIKKIWNKVDVNNHATEILKEVEK